MFKRVLVQELQKYSHDVARIRRSLPRLMVHDTSLMTYPYGSSNHVVLSDSEKRGHVVERVVGAYLIARSVQEGFAVFWWRTTKGEEVDCAIQKADMVFSVKSSPEEVSAVYW